LEAGYGAGWITSEYDAMGIPMDRPGVRIDRMVEHVELARAFFAGADLNMEGDHVTARHMAAIPPSPNEGGPKIMIGGGSPRVLGLAGKLADIVSVNFDNSAGKIGAHGIGSGTADGTARKIQWIKDGAGDRWDELEIEIGAYFIAVTPDGDEAANAGLAQMGKALGMSPEDADRHPHVLVGSPQRIAETLRARRDSYGISYINVASRNMQAFAPVVEALTGT
jgi:probable F420-dependent oxidoreductase